MQKECRYIDFENFEKHVDTFKNISKNDKHNDKPQDPSSGISPDEQMLIESWSDFGKEANKNIRKIVSEEKSRIQYSFEHIIREIEHSFGLSR